MFDLLFGYHVLVLEGSLDSKVYCREGSQSSHPIIIIIIIIIISNEIGLIQICLTGQFHVRYVDSYIIFLCFFCFE
jgi:hypothetical protein